MTNRHRSTGYFHFPVLSECVGTYIAFVLPSTILLDGKNIAIRRKILRSNFAIFKLAISFMMVNGRKIEEPYVVVLGSLVPSEACTVVRPIVTSLRRSLRRCKWGCGVTAPLHTGRQVCIIKMQHPARVPKRIMPIKDGRALIAFTSCSQNLRCGNQVYPPISVSLTKYA